MREEVDLNPRTWGGSVRKNALPSCGDCEHFLMSGGTMFCAALSQHLSDPFVALDCEWYSLW